MFPSWRAFLRCTALLVTEVRNGPLPAAGTDSTRRCGVFFCASSPLLRPPRSRSRSRPRSHPRPRSHLRYCSRFRHCSRRSSRLMFVHVSPPPVPFPPSPNSRPHFHLTFVPSPSTRLSFPLRPHLHHRSSPHSRNPDPDTVSVPAPGSDPAPGYLRSFLTLRHGYPFDTMRVLQTPGLVNVAVGCPQAPYPVCRDGDGCGMGVLAVKQERNATKYVLVLSPPPDAGTSWIVFPTCALPVRRRAP